MKDEAFKEMLALLKQLEEAHIAHSLKQVRDDALMIEVAVPGERWEIEFVDYGDEVHIEIERFVSKGAIEDESSLKELFATHSSFVDKNARSPVNHHKALT
jgi:hypothetical protein